MILLVMGRSRARRSAVAAGLAQQLGLDHVHVADDAAAGDGAAALRARLQKTPAGRAIVYSSPPLSTEACAALRQALRGLEVVRLKHEDEQLSPLPGALTLDADMADDVLIATIRAVLRI